MIFSLEQWVQFFLLFVRFTALVAIMPLFAWRAIPALTKIGFSGLLAYLLLSAVKPAAMPLPGQTLIYVLAVASEVLFGLALGFLAVLVFSAVRIAGQLVDLQGGMMMSSVFDPQYGGQVTVFGHFYYFFTIVFYLSLNGHHILLEALKRSVTLVPPGGAVFQAQLVPNFERLFMQMFIIAFQLAAPVVAILILSDAALGLLAKTVPQIHVFMVGMPLKVGVALLAVYLALPYLAAVVETVFAQFHKDILLLMQLF